MSKGMSKARRDVGTMIRFLQETEANGPAMFSAANEEPAFDAWWRKTYGKSQRGRDRAEKAWYELLRQLSE